MYWFYDCKEKVTLTVQTLVYSAEKYNELYVSESQFFYKYEFINLIL